MRRSPRGAADHQLGDRHAGLSSDGRRPAIPTGHQWLDPDRADGRRLQRRQRRAVGFGALASGAGALQLTNVAIITAGQFAAGIAISGPCSDLDTSGGGNAVTTSGPDADGVLVVNAAGVTFSASNPLPSLNISSQRGDLLHVDGTGSLLNVQQQALANGVGTAGIVGVHASAAGRADLVGGSVVSSDDAFWSYGAGSLITAQGTALSSTGVNAVAVLADGGEVRLTGGSVTTTNGPSAHGLQASGTADALITADGVTVNATGNGAHVASSAHIDFANGAITSGGVGVAVYDGGSATVTQSTVTLSANNGGGMLADGAGSTISATGLTVSGTHPGNYGVVALDQGQITIAGGSIVSVNSALRTASGGKITASGLTLRATGGDAIGVLADGGVIDLRRRLQRSFRDRGRRADRRADPGDLDEGGEGCRSLG